MNTPILNSIVWFLQLFYKLKVGRFVSSGISKHPIIDGSLKIRLGGLCREIWEKAAKSIYLSTVMSPIQEIRIQY